jgi:hypothetical protein
MVKTTDRSALRYIFLLFWQRYVALIKLANLKSLDYKSFALRPQGPLLGETLRGKNQLKAYKFMHKAARRYLLGGIKANIENS